MVKPAPGEAGQDLALIMTLEQGKPLSESLGEIDYAASCRCFQRGHHAATIVGCMTAGQCATTMKRLIMELGGHAPLIVFADADVEKAADIAIAAKFTTSGQDCLAANRIYVERPILKSFREAIATRIARLKVGPGLQPDTDIGPLMHERAIAKVEEQVADALKLGAKLSVGGRRHAAGPLFFQPTLLSDVPDDALIMREPYKRIRTVDPLSDGPTRQPGQRAACSAVSARSRVPETMISRISCSSVCLI